jgi:hypothetical protein
MLRLTPSPNKTTRLNIKISLKQNTIQEPSYPKTKSTLVYSRTLESTLIKLP